jgi:single-strand DNA-binding protein
VINRVVLVGRLTRDPELKTTTTGKSVCDFGIAVTKRIKPTDGSPDADFFNVSAWNQTAEYVSNYLHKGRLVAVDGRLQSRKYTAKDGTNREVIEVVADNVQGLDRPRDDDGAGHAAGGGAKAAVAAGSVPAADEYDPFADE